MSDRTPGELSSDSAFCRMIEAYWRERGYPKIKAWVESCQVPMMIGGKVSDRMLIRHSIASNLDERGFPPR